MKPPSKAIRALVSPTTRSMLPALNVIELMGSIMRLIDGIILSEAPAGKRRLRAFGARQA